MRKWYIISVIFIVFVAFAAVNVLGKERSENISVSANTTEAFDELAKAMKEKKQATNSTEIIAQNFVVSPVSSAEFLFLGGCDLSSLTGQVALARFINQSETLLTLNQKNRWPIASITKLLTAVVASENMDVEKTISLTKEAIDTEGIAGDFKEGEIFKISDLIDAILLVSSNDAAEAIAQEFGRNDFLALMNQKAKDIGMLNTFIYDPSGLSARNQSTPNDLYKLASYMYFNNPEFFKTTSIKKDYITEQKTGKRRTISNINEFAGQSNFIGGKTGFTEESQGNLLSIFKVDGQPLVIVILGSQDRFGETRKILNCIR